MLGTAVKKLSLEDDLAAREELEQIVTRHAAHMTRLGVVKHVVPKDVTARPENAKHLSGAGCFPTMLDHRWASLQRMADPGFEPGAPGT